MSHSRPTLLPPIATARPQSDRWVVILAGEARPPLGSLLPPWFWRPRPAQFRTLLGWRSVLRHTADRALHLVPGDRVITVIDREHYALFEHAAGEHYPGLVMAQPSRRGTAAEALLGVSAVLRRDPNATVLLLPASQFVFPEDQFLCAAIRACRLAEQDPAHPIVLGAAPDELEGPAVWIEPRDPLLVSWEMPEADVARTVPIRRFHERPDTEAAEELRRHGGLCSTMVVAANAARLWSLARMHLPTVLERFERYRGDEFGHEPTFRPTHDGARALPALYEELPRAELFRDILQRSAEAVVVLPVEGVQFSDLAEPQRLRPAVRRLLRRTAAPSVTH